jgi:hypothetical protein
MATVKFDIAYTQGTDVKTPGEITLNGVEKIRASGRLDLVGDTVYADGFCGVEGYEVSIECARTRGNTMQVKMYFSGFDVDSSAHYSEVVERVIDGVPITFS